MGEDKDRRRLFRVSVEVTTFVVASTRKEADRHADRALRAELDNYIDHAEISPATDVSKDWAKALPYGANDEDLTVEAWLARSSDQTKGDTSK